VVKLRVFQLYVLLKRAFGSIEAFAAWHLAFESLFDLFGSPSRPFSPVLLAEFLPDNPDLLATTFHLILW
jgi:hypothetical protein